MTGLWQSLVGKMMPSPGGIDCAEVMAQLYEYIDGELDDEKIERIRGHLEKCQRCYPRYNFEAAFLRFLKQQGRTKAPPELQRKIFKAILEEESRG
ncbi:MAG: mycothiol system anti-sigma-R factor [Gemmatimonadetes bacterium]|uniref:Mycothiol system anti-sigma-R factor n=1 Tax=Candidatus Kutchimonas denitrificans TaxID=3056748 RepID=A0AAE4Z5Z3_9BACT|nr:mycothiol system anti-sigma-R factor [Gemmatimonadota bacterium]NIR74379.1 mycothiol system anti-sigma-R factor [Candidatus Kutchimonas denitrificans]NIS02630.1 mycothiol system anti-sigma-R factor [Gemmatimonadota bacterium]NIT68505.1 mycothiol system anti-sigma-R factor [Gemmatimonadota bacterium]NIU51982.1 mycothiol system anti-sigma-R factor [Gemmatimonadota bacterium]